MAKSKGTWRSIAAPIIAKVLAETIGKEESEIRKALREAYPFGQRSLHPYKVWCDEIQKQRGIKKKKRSQQQSAYKQTELF